MLIALAPRPLQLQLALADRKQSLGLPVSRWQLPRSCATRKPPEEEEEEEEAAVAITAEHFGGPPAPKAAPQQQQGLPALLAEG